MRNAVAQARRPTCSFMCSVLRRSFSRIHLPHQPSKRRHRGQRSKRRLEPLDAAPKHRLVAVDDGLAECLLDIRDRFDLRRVGAAQENAVGVRAVVLARELDPFPRRDRREFERLAGKRHVMNHGKAGRAEIIDHGLVALVGAEQDEPAQPERLQCLSTSRLVATASMPVASCTISRMLPSPCGPCVIEVSVQWKTMRSGATSASNFADVAISSAIAASGRFHSPATRARATCTPRPGGAKWLNCGSVMLLTDGMIIPMRARGAGKELVAMVVTVAMIVPPR